MPVAMHLSDDTYICPNCGDKNLKEVEIRDKDFQSRNKLTTVQATSIADDDTFKIHACTCCGFKWIANEYIASTSQIAARLLIHFTKKLTDEGFTHLPIALEWLKKTTGLSLRGIEEAHYSPYMQRCAFLSRLVEFIEKADVEDLVTAYNDISNFSIQGGCSTEVQKHIDQPDLRRSEGQTLLDTTKPLKTTQVVADD